MRRFFCSCVWHIELDFVYSLNKQNNSSMNFLTKLLPMAVLLLGWAPRAGACSGDSIPVSTFPDTLTVCYNATVHLDTLTDDAYVKSYSILKTDGTTDDVADAFLYGLITDTLLIVRLEDSATGCSITDTILIKPADKLNAEFKWVRGVGTRANWYKCTFTAEDSSLALYIWDFGDGVVDTTGYQTIHEYEQLNDILPKLTVNDRQGCESTELNPTSVKESLLRTGLTITPNPFADRSTIRYELQQSEPIQISVLAIDGRIVKTYPIERQGSGAQQFTVRAEDLGAPGVYIVKLQAGDAVVTRRVVLSD